MKGSGVRVPASALGFQPRALSGVNVGVNTISLVDANSFWIDAYFEETNLVHVTVGDPAQAGYGNGYNYGYDDAMARRDRDAHYRAEAWRAQPVGLITVDTGAIAFGYSDGYWDNSHNWHRWHDKSEMRAYRDRNGSHYYDRDHSHYDNDGWQR